jgi:hypothetical protein
MPTHEHNDVSRSNFVAFSVSGTVNLDSAHISVSWSLGTYGDEALALDVREANLIMPFVTASSADLLREALYQFAEKL